MTQKISQMTAAGALAGTEQVEVAQLSTTVRRAASTISVLDSDNSYNDSASGFLAAGFATGDQVNVIGFTGALVNNIYSARVQSVTATKMVIASPEGDALVDAAAGDSVTISKWQTRRAGYAGGGASTFLALTDTPDTYTGQAGKVPRVSPAEDGLEFYTPSSGGGGSASYDAPLIAPPTAGWSWVNQGVATIQSDPNYQLLTVPTGVNVVNTISRVRTLPAPPYTATAAIVFNALERAFLGAGITLRESSSGKESRLWGTLNTYLRVVIDKANSANSFNSDYVVANYQRGRLLWLRVSDNGTTRRSFVSSNGLDWFLVFSVSRTDFLTPDQIGFIVSTFDNNGTTGSFTRLLSWEVV